MDYRRVLKGSPVRERERIEEGRTTPTSLSCSALGGSTTRRRTSASATEPWLCVEVKGGKWEEERSDQAAFRGGGKKEEELRISTIDTAGRRARTFIQANGTSGEIDRELRNTVRFSAKTNKIN